VSAHYRHTQVGWVIIASVLGSALALLALGQRGAIAAVLLPVAVVLLLVGIPFATLTVRVDEQDLLLFFGPGLVRKRVPLAEIRAYRAVKNPWYYGWGIHYFRGGAIYNVSGFGAVELMRKDGRRLRVGTDEPALLENALRQIIGESAPLTAEEESRTRRTGVRTLVLVVLLLLVPFGGLLCAQARPPVVTVSGDALIVDNLFYGERYPFGDVRSVSLEERLPIVLLRTNGYALGGTLRGKFRLAALGDGKLFVEAERPPFILVRTASTFVIVGFDDPNRTRAVYGEIRQVWERSRR
jgi:hypothetical protein